MKLPSISLSNKILFTFTTLLLVLPTKFLFSSSGDIESLLIKRGARASVFSDAFVSVADETNAIYYNPSGLAFLYSPEMILSHAIFVSEDRLSGFGYAFPTDIGTFAIAADYFSGPQIPRIYQGALRDSFSYYTGAGAFSYAFRLTDYFSLGTNFQHAIDVIDDSLANLTTIDAGFLIRTKNEVFSLGGAAENLATMNSSNISPNRLYRAGFSFKWSLPEHYSDITLAFGGSLADKQGAKPRYFAAIEHIGAKVLALRLGYEYITDEYQKTAADSLSTFNAGIGLRLGNFQINYSYKPLASLGDAQRIDVQWRLYGWGVRKKITEANLKIDPPVFSPNSDTARDNVFLIPSVTTIRKVDFWELKITSGPVEIAKKSSAREQPRGGKFLIRKFSDKEIPPKIIVWDGKDESGRLCPEGSYLVTFTAEDKFRKAISPDGKTVTIDLTPPTARLTAETTSFIPSPDGLGEKTTFYLDMSDTNGIDFWTLTITNFRGKPVKTFRSSNLAESLEQQQSKSSEISTSTRATVIWDGRDDYYETSVPPMDYTATLTAVDRGGNRSTSSVNIKILPKVEVIIREVPKQVEVHESPKGLVVTIASNVLFETGKHQLKEHAVKALDEVVELLKNYPENKVTIEGYTDSTGSRETNIVLSSKRAWGVYSYLVKHGIEPSRLTVKGRGSENPRASNRTEEGRALNRRVEITIHKKENLSSNNVSPQTFLAPGTTIPVEIQAVISTAPHVTMDEKNRNTQPQISTTTTNSSPENPPAK